ncbi:MAG: DNA adenine methylase [Candidatus Bathyarchaeota archaeon]|uniref:DNA adenine methylase n=1 Tax=Candidatus Bathycorpusculum sp. TaxID=2994959 RepID=UPI00282A4852|nr:DNA adenine methylase [Candidatus Termiticorpusculum sp.]MCL2256634.1 DNA adenine methylase [Candidatus Termiticorpusculum sp.]MCL2293187.1 DNA adenine methylase [Candidatus Termiticorpusculum sp.]
MNGKTPHLVQYQGSKRILAPQILRYMPRKFNRLLEPFSGMAAVTIATAVQQRAEHYIINDLNEPIIRLLEAVINTSAKLVTNYEKVWEQQFSYGNGHIEHFYYIRDKFNSGEQTPENMLYLLARCVKGAVRYGKNGKFNQSPDKRRHGTNPKNIRENVCTIARLLKGKTSFCAVDYQEIFDIAKKGDLVYMDPPYQGVTNTRDNRYFAGVEFDDFAEAIETLNHKEVDFLISYDGECGGKEYGRDLPEELNCTKLLLNAGISTQSTLLGERNTTYEALYVSRNLSPFITPIPEQLTLIKTVM